MTLDTMKTTINLTDCVVTLKAENPFTGEPMCQEYSIPTNGGYVRDGDGRQVCYSLASRGDTLTAATPQELLALIRREWRAMRRDAANA